MILDKEVEVRWHASNKNYYVTRGYQFTKYKDKFSVRVEDLPKGSHAKVLVQCDYCGEKITKEYRIYLKQNEFSIIKKDACKNCRSLKIKESNLKTYGVENVMDVQECRDSIKDTMFERYGVENYSQTDEYKEKFKETSLTKYGVEHPFQAEEVKDKITSTMIERYGVDSYTKTDEYKQKTKKTNMERYGVEHPVQNEKVFEKIKNTTKNIYGEEYIFQTDHFKNKAISHNLKKYNKKYYSQTNSFKKKASETWSNKTEDEIAIISDKRKQTMIERYGVPYAFQSKEIMTKVMNTMYKNGTVPTSQAQMQTYKTLKELQYNVELNYPYSRCSLDIALFYENIKIDVEYDGSYWHQDSQRDRRRDEFMKSEGWKVLRVKGRRNPPTSEQLVDAVNELISTDRQFKQIYVEQDIDKMEVI